MAWFKVDDAFLMSSKVLRLPRSIRTQALGVWLQAGVWAAHEMKDGLVPAHILEEYGCTTEVRAALLESHLWVEAEKGAIYFHNWSDYQPTREQLEAKQSEVSAKRSAAGRLGAMAKWQNDGKRMAKSSPEPEPEPEPKKELMAAEAADVYTAAFNSFYSAYPRKVGKRAAFAKWQVLLRGRVATAEEIIAGAQRFAADPNLPRDANYIPHPATWLNAGRWDDESLPERRAETKAQQNFSMVEHFARIEQKELEA